jgi:hypothetical protein
MFSYRPVSTANAIPVLDVTTNSDIAFILGEGNGVTGELRKALVQRAPGAA